MCNKESEGFICRLGIKETIHKRERDLAWKKQGVEDKLKEIVNNL